MSGSVALGRLYLQREAVRFRGRVAVFKQAINKARDAQWEKESK